MTIGPVINENLPSPDREMRIELHRARTEAVLERDLIVAEVVRPISLRSESTQRVPTALR